MQEHCRRLMILKVVTVIGRRVRKDEIRGKENAEREEERIRGGPRRQFPCVTTEVDQPGLFERACGPTMPTSAEPTTTHFTRSIIFRTRFHVAAPRLRGYSPSTEGAPPRPRG